MRFIGHTMGTPNNTLEEAIAIFAAMGLDGIEIVCKEGTVFDSSIDDAEARRLAEFAREAGCPVVTITPYAWDINSADADLAAAQLKELCRAIDLAQMMGADHVRAYGGKEVPDDMEGGFTRTVDALKEAGAYAALKGITVLVENHPGTMVRTGTATRRVIDAVDMLSVRALYDPGNVLHDTDEDWETTYNTQRGIIGYVHVKDYDDRSGTRHACNVGDGVVPWADILAKLKADGYDGCCSFEYEKKWYPEDLDDAEVGMTACYQYVKRGLGL